MDELIKAIIKIKTKQQAEQFINALFTEKEIREFNNRIEIVKLIFSGVTHHKIAKDLNVGIATVTRGSREVKKGNFNFLKK